jgi:hypothetical protein
MTALHFPTQVLFRLLTPLLFAAQICMLPGRTIRVGHDENTRLPPVKWATWIFLGADFLTLDSSGRR